MSGWDFRGGGQEEAGEFRVSAHPRCGHWVQLQSTEEMSVVEKGGREIGKRQRDMEDSFIVQ